jgi:DNA-binding transcriptional LysR family regulator
MDYFKAMDSFVRVARAGSFSAAAVETGMSRAMVTKHIAALEGRVGVRLLNRTTRRVSLTEMGVQFYEFGARMLRELAEQELALGRLQREPAGVLRIIAPRSFGTLHLGSALAKFSAAYPDIHVTLILGDSSANDFDFASEFDLAIRLTPIASSTIVARKIASLQWAVCASPEYLLRHGEPAQPKDLAGHNCLLHAGNYPDRLWRFGDARRHSAIQPRGNFSTDSVIALRDAAIGGLGIALLPLYCASEALRAKQLVRILAGHPLPDSPLYVLIPDNRHVPRKVRTLIAFLAKWAGSELS